MPSSHKSDAERRRPETEGPRGRWRFESILAQTGLGPLFAPAHKRLSHTPAAMLQRLRSSLAPRLRAFSGEAAASSFGFDLSDDTKAYQELARKFAKEEIIPVAADYDRSMVYPTPLFKKAWEVSVRVIASLFRVSRHRPRGGGNAAWALSPRRLSPFF